MRPAEQSGEHLSGLIAIVVDRLLAQDHQVGFFLFHDAFEDLGDRERLRALLLGLDQDAAIGPHGQCGPDGLAGLLPTDRDADDLGCLALLLEADRLFDGDLVEGVHRHLDVGELDPGAVRLDPDLHVEIDDAFYGHEDFHEHPLGMRPAPA